MCPLPKWQKCLIGHSLRNSAHSSVHARRWHFCHLCPRPARILVHSVMNGRGIWFRCRSVRCAPPPLYWSCIPVPIVQRLLVCCPWRSRVPAYVCGSMRACAGGRSVPLVGASRYYSFAAFGGGRAPAAVRRAAAGAHRLRCVAGSPALSCRCAPRRRALHPRPPHLRRGVGARRGCGLRPNAAAPRPPAPVRALFVPQALPLVLSCRFAALCAVRPQMGFLARLARGGGLYRHVPRARPLAPLRSRRAPCWGAPAGARGSGHEQKRSSRGETCQQVEINLPACFPPVPTAGTEIQPSTVIFPWLNSVLPRRSARPRASDARYSIRQR